MLCHSLVSLDLNIFTVVLVTVSVLSLFQLSNTLVEKKLRRGPEVYIRKYFFSQRVIDYWNALPQTAIDAKSINKFKSQLKIHLNNIIRGLHKPLAFSLFPTPLLN